MNNSLLLIDSHQHVFWHGRDDDGLIADLDEHGIEKAWLLTWDDTIENAADVPIRLLDPRFKTMGSNESLIPLHTVIETCRRYPDRFIPGYCPNPLDPHAVSKLKAAIDIHRIRICGEWKFSMLFDDPRCIELFRTAGEKKLPVVLHIDVPYLPPAGGRYVGHGYWRGGTIDNLIRALRACPETNFIGHAPGFWRELSGEADTYGNTYLKPPLAAGGRLPDVLEEHPNLYADLSAGSALRALMTDRDIARRFILRFEDRLLFGRDYYGNELISFLKSLQLPNQTWKKIGRMNAERLLSGTTPDGKTPMIVLAKTGK